MINKIVFNSLILLIIFVAKLIFTTQIIYGASLNLAWDANTEGDIAGYKIYYEISSRDYGETIDVENITTYELSGLTDGTTYYIALTAYDILNNESEKSDEINASTNVAETCIDGIDNDGLCHLKNTNSYYYI